MSFMTRLAAAAVLSLSTALPAAAQEGTLNISVRFISSDPVPDPRAGYSGWMSNQTGVTETLMGIDYELNLYPRLAEGIVQSSSATWRVTLRDGLTFHHRTAVTAQAVVYAITPISDEGQPGHKARIANLLDLACIWMDGDNIVVFETNSPNAAFPWTLSEPGIAIRGAASEDYLINGTGPYVFQEAIPEQLYRVAANTDHRSGAPGFEDVRVVGIPDPGASALAFEAGEVDMVINYLETGFLHT